MLFRCKLLESDEENTKRLIAKYQRDRDSWAITDLEYEEKYESVMQDFRLRFAQILDGASWDAYNTYKNEHTPPTPDWIQGSLHWWSGKT